MIGPLWPAWVDITLGGLGVGFALWSIERRRAGKPMHPDARKADIGLLAFGVLLVVIGVMRSL